MNKLEKSISKDIQFFYLFANADINNLSSNCLKISSLFSEPQNILKEPIYNFSKIDLHRKIEKKLKSLTYNQINILYATFATPNNYYLSHRYPRTNLTALQLFQRYFSSYFGAALNQTLIDGIQLVILLDQYFSKSNKLSQEELQLLQQIKLNAQKDYLDALQAYRTAKCF